MARARFQINPNAYNAGAVRFQVPHNNYMSQMLMHQMSKQEALGQYYDKLLTNINPQGVRSQDLEGWMKKVNDWQEFGSANRSALINPRLDQGRAQIQFRKMHTDLLGDIDKSKRAAESENQVRSVYLDPNKRKLATDQDMAISHAMSKSIYDPEHYKDNAGGEWTPADFSYNAPPFDIKQQGDVIRFATRGLKPEKTLNVKGKHTEYENGVPQRVIVPWTSQYNKDALNQIGQRVASAYDQNKGMQAYFDNAIHDENTYSQLNSAGKKAFGDDFEIGTDPRKAAAAWAIANNTAVSSGQDTWPYKNPPRPKEPSQRQQQEQDMLNWIKGTANAIRGGDANEFNRLAGVLYSGNGKRQYISSSERVSPNSDKERKGFTIHSYESQWVPDDVRNPSGPGTKKDVKVDNELEANDPQLENKLGQLYQLHMGSTPGMEKVILKQTVRPQSQNSKPTSTNLHPDDLLNKYLPTQ